MDFLVRAATPADVPSICTIGKQTDSFEVSEGIHFYEDSEVMEWAKNPQGNVLLVAETGGRICGFLFCKVLSWHWAMLDTLYVLPEFRQGGCASALLRELDARLSGIGVKYLSSLVAQQDTETASWLAQKGFSREKTYDWFEKFLD